MENESNKKSRPLFFRILRVLLFVFGGIFLLSLIMSAIFEDKIGRALVNTLNKNMENEMYVGNVDLAFITSFPNASVNLNDVIIPDAFGDTLLDTRTISFKFKILSLLGNTFKINNIAIAKGTMRVTIDENGKTNYDIFNTSETTVDTTSGDVKFSLSIKQATLDNLNFIYDDYQYGQRMKLFLEKVYLEGDFSDEDFGLRSYAEIHSDYIEMDSLKYFANTDLAYDALIEVNVKESLYRLEDVNVYIETNTYEAKGTIQETKNGTDLNVQINGIDCSIRSIIKMLPKEYVNVIRDFNSKGNFYFNADLLGTMSERSVPEVSVEFGLQNGRVTSPRINTPLKDVSFTALYNSGKALTKDGFEIKDFKAQLNNEPLAMQLKIENLDNPAIDLYCNGRIAIASVYKLLGEDFSSGSGIVNIESITLEGKYNDMLTTRGINRVATSGLIEFEDIRLKQKGELLTIPQGNFSFIDNDFQLRNFEFRGYNSDIKLNGNLENLVPVLFKDSTNTRKVNLKFDGSLVANNLDFDKLLSFADAQAPTEVVEDSLQKEQNQNISDFTGLLNGEFSINIGAFNYHKLNGKNLKGELEIRDNKMILKNAGVDMMDGNIKLTASATFKESPYLEAFIECNKLDGKEFFRQNEDFGQDYLSYKNIKGTLDAKIIVNADFDAAGNLLYDKLYALADMNLTDGELSNFKMLEDFSSFVKIEDLKDVDFADLRTQLKIENSTIYIPTTFIQSSALNMTLAGKQTFDYQIDYQVKVNAAQIVWNRYFKSNPNGEKPVKAKKNGWANLYFKLYGTSDNPQYEMNRKEVKAALAMQQEFQDIKNTISTKFATKIDEPLDWSDDDNDDGGFNEF